MKKHGHQLTKKGEPMSNFVSHLSKDAAATQGDLFLVLRNKTRPRIIDLLSRYKGLCQVPGKLNIKVRVNKGLSAGHDR